MAVFKVIIFISISELPKSRLKHLLLGSVILPKMSLIFIRSEALVRDVNKARDVKDKAKAENAKVNFPSKCQIQSFNFESFSLFSRKTKITQ